MLFHVALTRTHIDTSPLHEGKIHKRDLILTEPILTMKNMIGNQELTWNISSEIEAGGIVIIHDSEVIRALKFPTSRRLSEGDTFTVNLGEAEYK